MNQAKKLIDDWHHKIHKNKPDVISYELISLVEYVINKTEEKYYENKRY